MRLRKKKKNKEYKFRMFKGEPDEDGLFTVWGRNTLKTKKVEPLSLVNVTVVSKYPQTRNRKMRRKLGLKFRLFDAIETERHGE